MYIVKCEDVYLQKYCAICCSNRKSILHTGILNLQKTSDLLLKFMNCGWSSHSTIRRYVTEAKKLVLSVGHCGIRTNEFR